MRKNQRKKFRKKKLNSDGKKITKIVKSLKENINKNPRSKTGVKEILNKNSEEKEEQTSNEDSKDSFESLLAGLS